jgi:hypothetical protein
VIIFRLHGMSGWQNLKNKTSELKGSPLTTSIGHDASESIVSESSLFHSCAGGWYRLLHNNFSVIQDQRRTLPRQSSLRRRNPI